MMLHGSRASVVPWVLMVVFLVLIDTAVTRSAFVWDVSSLENTHDITQVMFGHTHRVARLLHTQGDPDAIRIALLGNSRIWIPAQAAYLARELAYLAPDMPLVIDNLGIFGARLGDMEIISRHLDALDPSLVILAIAGADLISTPSIPLVNLPGQLLDVGWRDGPVPPDSAGARVDRWARTVWPLYRYREFIRAAIANAVHPAPDPGPFPHRFETTRALFDYMHGPRGAEAEAAYQAWRTDPTLEAFVRYLEVGSAGHLEMVRRRLAEQQPLRANSPSVVVLDTLLGRLARGPWRTVVLLMPETPLLQLDTAGRFHHPGASDAAAEYIRRAAARHQIAIVDARDWMPAEAFIDFDHLMPDLSGFQRPLAKEIVSAVRS